MKIEYSLQIFENEILRYQIWWKSVHWEPSYSMRLDRWTESQDEANSRLFAIFVPKNIHSYKISLATVARPSLKL